MAGSTICVADHATDIILSIEPMLLVLARRLMPPRTSFEDIEDVLQACRLHLWHRALPLFDPSRGVKPSTFAFTCARNFIAGEAAKARRAKRRRPHRLIGEPLARDDRDDQFIADLADAIRASPNAHGLTPRDVLILETMLKDSGENTAVLSARHGFAQPSSFSSAKRRVRERIASLI